jgi:transposase
LTLGRENQVLGKAVVRYSEAFKIQVVRELEEGRFESVLAAQRAYGVKGAQTVANWMRRLGKDHLLGKVVRVMKADERTELQELRKRVRQLERLVADKELDLRIEQAYVKLACGVAGVDDVGEFKKKHAGGLRTK